jgi:hypothetical protein
MAATHIATVALQPLRRVATVTSAATTTAAIIRPASQVNGRILSIVQPLPLPATHAHPPLTTTSICPAWRSPVVSTPLYHGMYVVVAVSFLYFLSLLTLLY